VEVGRALVQRWLPGLLRGNQPQQLDDSDAGTTSDQQVAYDEDAPTGPLPDKQQQLPSHKAPLCAAHPSMPSSVQEEAGQLLQELQQWYPELVGAGTEKLPKVGAATKQKLCPASAGASGSEGSCTSTRKPSRSSATRASARMPPSSEQPSPAAGAGSDAAAVAHSIQAVGAGGMVAAAAADDASGPPSARDSSIAAAPISRTSSSAAAAPSTIHSHSANGNRSSKTTTDAIRISSTPAEARIMKITAAAATNTTDAAAPTTTSAAATNTTAAAATNTTAAAATNPTAAAASHQALSAAGGGIRATGGAAAPAGVTGSTLRLCDQCGAVWAAMLCAGCGLRRYCGPPCQRAHWKAHRPQCKEAQRKRADAAVAAGPAQAAG
jgi:hypothetical protein